MKYCICPYCENVAVQGVYIPKEAYLKIGGLLENTEEVVCADQDCIIADFMFRSGGSVSKLEKIIGDK